jgi:hypothetical protein
LPDGKNTEKEIPLARNNTFGRMKSMADQNLNLLATQGDPLERLICRDFDSLALVLASYASIWARHIYPRRIRNGAFIVNEWLPFAGRHYTALLRLHHAFIARRTIVSLCHEASAEIDSGIKEGAYARLLEIHSSCAAFWENLGASIDNFFEAKREATKLLFPKAEILQGHRGRTVSEVRNPKLYYAFGRRSQFIHSILVPVKLEDGMVTFNLVHYDDENTNWHVDREVMQNIDSQIENDWASVLVEFGNEWAGFSSWLDENDPPEMKLNVKIDNLRGFEEPPPPSGTGQSISGIDIPPSGTG